MFKSLGAKLGHILVLYGGWGLLAMSFLDSSFLPFPVLNDLALIVLSSQHPNRAVFYALQSTVGSVLGCYLIYSLARSGGKLLRRKTTPKAVESAERWLQRNDFVSLLVASLLPPPAPLKIFVITAGALRVNAVHFGIALLVGRLLRFGAEAWLGARYGTRAQDYLKHNLGWVSLALIALIVGLTLVYRVLNKRQKLGSEEASPKYIPGEKV